jgi:UDP-N-acetyl-2-amino-2-deoxyglucuronate dehydrogenase
MGYHSNKKIKMSKYKMAIVGCGAILPRHLESIESNDSFELVSVCDIQTDLVENLGKKLNLQYFTDFKKLIDSKIANFITIATPNSLHVDQAIYALENGCDVLVEKPVSFTKNEVDQIIKVAEKNGQNAYCVLQVRLNPTVSLMKEILDLNLLGKIRSVNFVQRWQRPYEYFTGWRALPNVGGGTLYEVGIHYLDVLQKLFGKPSVHSSKVYSTKHIDVDIEDTIYSIFDFGQFGGTCEVTIAAEPNNLECSLSVIGSNGYVKLGGKALNIIESANFLSHGSQTEFDKIKKKYSISTEPNNYGSYQGSCPNHPYVYQNLEDFKMDETLNVISLIDEIYEKSNMKYRKTNED